MNKSDLINICDKLNIKYKKSSSLTELTKLLFEEKPLEHYLSECPKYILNKYHPKFKIDHKIEDIKYINFIKLEFRNFMIYGDNITHEIDLRNGICGKIGNNASGKTTILLIIIYCLFGNLYKLKPFNLINYNSDDFYIKLTYNYNGVEKCIEKSRFQNNTSIFDKEHFYFYNLFCDFSNDFLNMGPTERTRLFKKCFNVNYIEEMHKNIKLDIKKYTEKYNIKQGLCIKLADILNNISLNAVQKEIEEIKKTDNYELKKEYLKLKTKIITTNEDYSATPCPTLKDIQKIKDKIQVIPKYNLKNINKFERYEKKLDTIRKNWITTDDIDNTDILKKKIKKCGNIDKLINIITKIQKYKIDLENYNLDMENIKLKNQISKMEHIYNWWDNYNNIKRLNEINNIIGKFDESNLENGTEKIIILKEKIKQYNKLSIEYNLELEHLYKMKQKLEWKKKYASLFGTKGIANDILYNKIIQVEYIINNFLKGIVKWKIKIVKNEFIIIKNNKELNEIQISGYERMLINLSIKYALNKLNNVKFNIILIDEKLDCIDSQNSKKINSILQKLKEEYKLVFIISHNKKFEKYII